MGMIKHYIKGVRYSMQVDPYDETLGIVEMKIGQVRSDFYFLRYTNLYIFEEKK